MSAKISLSQLLSDLAADVTTIGFDLPGSVYDQVHGFLNERALIPRATPGRLAVVAAILVASRIAKQKIGELKPLPNFLHEVASDGMREQIKRILESTSHPESAARAGKNTIIGRGALLQLSTQDRKRLLDLFNSLIESDQQHLREQMPYSSKEDLMALANLSIEDAHTALNLLHASQ